MKKILAVILSLMLCLGVSAIALAGSNDGLFITPSENHSDRFVSAAKTDFFEMYHANWGEGQLPMAAVRCSAVDTYGNLWVGTYGGGIAMRPAGSDKFSVYSLTTPGYELKNDKVYSMVADDKGGVWIGQMYSEDPDNSGGAAYYKDGKVTYFDTSTPNTIANNCVLLPLIDPNGIIWFGTGKGLSRYNPETGEWRSYTKEDGLITDSISFINYDSQGNLWYGCYHGRTDYGTKENPLIGGYGYIDPEGNNHDTMLVADYSEEYGHSYFGDIWPKDIEEDADGNIWIVSSGSLANEKNKGGVVFVLDKNQKLIKKITGQELLGDRINQEINSEIRSLEIDAAGTMWFATWNGVYAYNPKAPDSDLRCFSAATGDWNLTNTTQNAQFDNIYCINIRGDKMYICSLGGLVIRDFEVKNVLDEKPEAEYYAMGKFEEGTLPFASVRAVVKDTEGGLWVGTNGGGLAYKPADSEVFTEYSLTSTRLTLGSDVVQALAVDDKGGIWISQAKSYVDSSQNKGVAYYYNGEITYYDESVPNTIPNNYVQEIEIDAEGKVWFGSFGGLTCYNPANDEWVTYTAEEDGLPAPSVDAIAFDAKGGVWYGCYPSGAGTQASPFVGGFGCITAEGLNYSWALTADYSTEYNTSLLADVWVRDMAVDAAGGVWVVCSGSYGNMPNKGGVIFYVDSDYAVAVCTGKDLLGDKLTGNSEIRCVEIDESGTVWFGTWNGVYAFNWDKQDERCFSAANGDWNNAEMQSQLDAVYSLDIIDGQLYIGSNGGVCVRSFEPGDKPEQSTGIFLNLREQASGRAIVNGAAKVLDVAPEIIDGTTFVPVRFVTENLGLTNNWSTDKPEQVLLIGAGFEIELTIGSAEVKVNGESKQLLAAPFVKDNRTMVPLRFLSETLKHTVNFDAATMGVSIY